MASTAEKSHHAAARSVTKCNALTDGARAAAAATTADVAVPTGMIALAWSSLATTVAWKKGFAVVKMVSGSSEERAWYWTNRKAAPPTLETAVDARLSAGRRATGATEGRSAFWNIQARAIA